MRKWNITTLQRSEVCDVRRKNCNKIEVIHSNCNLSLLNGHICAVVSMMKFTMCKPYDTRQLFKITFCFGVDECHKLHPRRNFLFVRVN